MHGRPLALAAAALLAAPAPGLAADARPLLAPASAFGSGWSTLLTDRSTAAEAQRFDPADVPRGLVTAAAFRQVRRRRPSLREGTSEVVLHRSAEAAARRFAFREEQLGRASTEPVPAIPALGQGRIATATRYERGGSTWCAVGALVLEGRALVTVSLGQPIRRGCPPGAALRTVLARAHRRVADR